MSDDWKARAVPAVYPLRRLELAELDERPKQVDEYKAAYKKLLKQMGNKAAAEMFGGATGIDAVNLGPSVRYQFIEKDADDYARPARVIAPSVPEGVAWRLRGLQRLVEAAPVGDWTIEAVIPSAANLREHHMTRATRAKKARKAAFDSVPYALRNSMDATLLPAKHSALVVLMVRQAPRAIDSDNCAAALKAWRDGIADALCINDRDKRVQWETEQCKCNVPSLRVYVVTR